MSAPNFEEGCWICGRPKGQPPDACPGHYAVPRPIISALSTPPPEQLPRITVRLSDFEWRTSAYLHAIKAALGHIRERDFQDYKLTFQDPAGARDFQESIRRATFDCDAFVFNTTDFEAVQKTLKHLRAYASICRKVDAAILKALEQMEINRACSI